LSELEMFLTSLRDNKPLLQEQYGVNTLGVFGSFVRGDQDKNSDVDILVDSQWALLWNRLIFLVQKPGKSVRYLLELILTNERRH
jgi:predicted nucleotidyltransferase